MLFTRYAEPSLCEQENQKRAENQEQPVRHGLPEWLQFGFLFDSRVPWPLYVKHGEVCLRIFRFIARPSRRRNWSHRIFLPRCCRQPDGIVSVLRNLPRKLPARFALAPAGLRIVVRCAAEGIHLSHREGRGQNPVSRTGRHRCLSERARFQNILNNQRAQAFYFEVAVSNTATIRSRRSPARM